MQEYGLIETSAAGDLPVSLADMKKHLRIIGNDADDSYITDLMNSAELILEKTLNIPLRVKTYIQTFPSFSGAGISLLTWQYLHLWRNPVVSIQSFTMLDFDNVAQPVTQYQFRKSKWPATLAPLAGYYWPVIKYRTMEAITVAYTAGYAAGALPADLRLAMRYLVSHMYENREPVVAQSGVVPYEFPMSLTRLITSLRYGGFA